MQATFDELLGDPWFSSTWTLQEAVANPDSILISRDGLVLYSSICGATTTVAEYFRIFDIQSKEPNCTELAGGAETKFVTLRDLVGLYKKILVFLQQELPGSCESSISPSMASLKRSRLALLYESNRFNS
jgi:hypothetical protein